MKKLIVMLLVLVGSAWLGSCRKDVLTPPLPSLTGIWKGTYTVQDGDQVPEVQKIIWTFRASSYKYSLDTTTTPKPTRIFCDAYGAYELSSGVGLTQDANLHPPDVCNADKNPTGLFTIVNQTETELLLVQQVGAIRKEIRLTKTL